MWQYILYTSTALLASLVSGTVLLFYTSPKHVLYWALQLQARFSGMNVKYIGDEKGFIYCYGERGTKHKNKTSILMVHGFTATKDQWLALFKTLPSDIHLIAVDLPGHGGSSDPQPDDKIGLMFQVEHLRKFIRLVGLDKSPFHLMGSSLGGATVGIFAAEYPELIDKLTLVCPAMRTPEKSPFTKSTEIALAKGIDNVELKDCSLLPVTSGEAQLMLDVCVYHKKSINRQVLQGLVDLRKPRNPYFLKLFMALGKEESPEVLEKRANEIISPTQIIWGRSDEIIDISGVNVLEKILPNLRQTDIIDRAGHSIQLDRPGAMTKAILTFRGEYQPRNTL